MVEAFSSQNQEPLTSNIEVDKANRKANMNEHYFGNKDDGSDLEEDKQDVYTSDTIWNEHEVDHVQKKNDVMKQEMG
ncbi:hypothetical protein V6N11_038020 [Hibiscus sabdariffa]|uniref:Uncharacterized protein n=2 Tax=Hibiscus sabdariffa TaxID=183260 RepID=A0ABR1ZNU7_9ROSI